MVETLLIENVKPSGKPIDKNSFLKCVCCCCCCCCLTDVSVEFLFRPTSYYIIDDIMVDLI